MEQNNVSVRKFVIENELKYNGVTLLSYKIEYPVFSSSIYQKCLGVVNKFYREKAVEFKEYCETELFPMAVEQYKEDVKNNFPVRMFEATQVYETTYLHSCIISLYFDRYVFTGGAHGNTVRESQTWNIDECGLIGLDELILCPPDYKTYILEAVKSQIEREPDIYFENYEELIAETFNPDSFYCTAEGIVVYYQQYDIAPYSSGIREFMIPYTSCEINPQDLCG